MSTVSANKERKTPSFNSLIRGAALTSMISTDTSESKDVLTSSTGEPVRARFRPVDRMAAVLRRRHWVVAAAAFWTTIGISFVYHPLSQPERGDPAIYEYIAQTILRGGVPYRDVIDPKGPGAMYLSAGAMWAGGRLGIEDVLAARYLYIVLAGVLSVLIALAAQR